MTRQEFLDKLKLALNGKVSPSQVEEHLRFYEDYINMEVRKGMEEEEVLASLGDPRLIARTIVETTGGGRTSEEQTSRGNEYGESADGRYGKEDEVATSSKYELSKVPSWVWLVLAILIIIVILSIVFSVISALLPFVLPILLVVLVVKIFRDR